MEILIIALSVVKRLLRSKSLICVLLVNLIILALTSAPLIIAIEDIPNFGDKAAKEAAKDWFYTVPGIISMFISLVGLLAGVSVIRNDIEAGTIFSVLSKPVKRWEYLLGNYLGASCYLLLTWGMVSSIYFSCIYILSLYLGAQQWSLHLVSMLARILLSLLIMSLGFCLAQRFTPLVAATTAVILYHGGALEEASSYLFHRLGVDIPYGVSQALAFPFPAINKLDPLFNLVKNASQTPSYPNDLTWLLLHLLDYSVILVLLASWWFSSQELSPSTD